MSRQVQTKSAYVQTVPDSKCLCPDCTRRNVDMSGLSCVQNFSCVLRAFKDKFVQTIPDRNSMCPDFHAFFSRPSCAPTQIRAFNAKFLVRPCPDHRAFMSRISSVHQTEKKLHPVVLCYSLKMKTERVPKFHKSRCLRFFKKFDFKSILYTIEGKTDPSKLGFRNLVVISTFKLYLHFPRFFKPCGNILQIILAFCIYLQ